MNLCNQKPMSKIDQSCSIDQETKGITCSPDDQYKAKAIPNVEPGKL